MPSPQELLADLGLDLPAVVKPVAAYVPAVRFGNYVYTAGQVPMRDGKLIATGKLGGEISPEVGVECARQCALNALAAIASQVDLSSVKRVVKVLAFVASTPDFTGQPQIANGASERLAEVALAWHREGGTAPEPRPAATVILLRDPGPQVYLLRRTASMAFAAGMTVFPGGRVDPSDSAVADAWTGPSPEEFGTRLGCTPELAVAYVAAAVRETFEESGVLLAGPSADSVVADTTGADWEADRVALEDRSLSFADFLHGRGLVLRADLLGPWAHWITPEFEPRRYDTRFFLAALPSGQKTRDVSRESDQVAWVPPAEAARQVDAGELDT